MNLPVTQPKQAIPQEKKLLYFGMDYLTINLMNNYPTTQSSQFMSFLDQIFNFPHNDTNANQINNYQWPGTNYHVKIIYSQSPTGEVAQIHFQDTYILQIVLVSKEKLKQIKYPYKYRISIYGMFFNAVRRKELDFTSFIAPLLSDIQNGSILSSISRIDLCADIAGMSPKEIVRGITGSKKHRKKLSWLNQDPISKEVETIYYGNKKNKWYARIYNKLKDIVFKGKDKLYAEYFQYEKVTRVEIESRSDVCLNYSLSLDKCLHNNYLWSFYEKILRNQYVQWKITSFIQEELKRQNYASTTLQKREHVPENMSKQAYKKKVLHMLLRFEERYAEDGVVFVQRELPLMRTGSNQDSLKSTF